MIRFKSNCSFNELFPATLEQVHQLMDMEQLGDLEYSSKVNNIVRGMKIHGPLNINSLSKALEQVVKLHHILTLRTLHTKEQYMLQSSPGNNGVYNTINLMYTSIADNTHVNLSVVQDNTNELPTSILAQERCRPFSISIKDDSSSSIDNNTSLSSTCDMHVMSITENDSANAKDKDWQYTTLMRVKLLQYSLQDHLLVLSFSRLVCDYWSSCLFLQQLSQVYTQLEAGTQASRTLTKSLRDDSRSHFTTFGGDRFNRSFPGARSAFVRTASKLQPIKQSNLTMPLPTKAKHHSNNTLQSTQLHFQQVAKIFKMHYCIIIITY